MSSQTIIEGLECVVTPAKDKSKAVILLHGYGANMHDLKPLGDVIPGHENFTWYFPNAPIALDMMMSFMDSRAWFPIDMVELQRAQMEGRFRDFSKPASEEFFTALHKAQLFLDEVLTSHDQVILGGFSQGAMLASHLGMINASKLSALLLYSAVLIDDAKYSSYQTDIKLPIVQSHGTQDQVLDVRAAHSLRDALKEKGHNLEFVEFTGGHEIPHAVLDSTARLLKTFY
jgi:phospholipase/carboxylesterase